ncbi:MAG: secondary thiamine-phosphate synthase enzyme YjbQ [Candidatus Sericytochromatia bacterium]
MSWVQRELLLAPLPRGCHLITERVSKALPELPSLELGWLQVFIQHTSASLTLNENADPSVRRDFERVLNRLVPEAESYEHADEGPDDMPAHIKASLLGPSLLLPVRQGRLALGRWQGVYLCEHREQGGSRHLLLTLQGQSHLR